MLGEAAGDNDAGDGPYQQRAEDPPKSPISQWPLPARSVNGAACAMDKLTALMEMGEEISPNSVRKLLTELGFSRQANRKSEEGAHHPDRNAQFEYINAEVLAAQASGQLVISVDTKKKELIGNFRNGGTDYRRKGDPQRVNVHDFADKDLGKVAPYGVYDITANMAGSALASRTTRPSSPYRPFALGSPKWDAGAIQATAS